MTQTLNESYRVLGDGGLMIVVTPGSNFPYVIPAIEEVFGKLPTISMREVFGHEVPVLEVVK